MRRLLRKVTSPLVILAPLLSSSRDDDHGFRIASTLSEPAVMKALMGSIMLMLGIVANASAIDGFEVLHSFGGGGGSPGPGLVKASDGNYYGTANNGGALGYGTVFRLQPDGTRTTIHDFDFSGGFDSMAPLIQGTDGNLYGTTYGGGFGFGTVFRVSLSGAFTTIHRFENDSDGWFPQAPLVQAGNGNLYGTTSSGSSPDHFKGTVFRIDGAGAYHEVHVFNGSDGSFPKAGLVQATDGNLYGTTESGGTHVQGTVFRVALPPETVTSIFSFQGSDGSNPKAALIQGSDGLLYGTTENGGQHGYGTAFRISLSGVHTLLHSFELDFLNGLYPTMPLRESAGFFYGTTSRGGTSDLGVVFRMDAAGSVATLHSFDSSEGGNPSGLIDAGGHFYGTTPTGGTGGAGTVFRTDTSGNYELVSAFVLGDGGSMATLVTGCDGNPYGTTYSGGPGGGGTIFRVEPDFGVTTIHAFGPDSAGGFHPQGALDVGSDCKIYGTTFDGGAAGYGTVFSVTTDGDFAVLHSLDGTGGSHPAGGVIQASDDRLYGTTREGGVQSLGTVFRLDTSGQFESLHSFDLPEGYDPTAPLLQASDGFIYGTTFSGGNEGSLFRVDTAGNFALLHAFSEAEGTGHWGGLVEAAPGKLYGPALVGGANLQGTVYRYDIASGTVDVVHDFVGFAEGGGPASLRLADDGFLYGTGTILEMVFRMSLTGETSVRHVFTGPDGAGVFAPLMQAPDGDLYGLTSGGGEHSRGVLFRIGTGDAFALTSVVPSSGPASGGWRVTAGGNGFTGAAAFSIGGTACSDVTLVSTTQISGNTPSLVPGTLNDVTVTNPGAAAGASATLPNAFFADFLDVPQEDNFHDFVEAVFRAGITAGCGNGNYCRDAPVTRAQMAVFLLKAEHGSSYAPPPCTGVFADVACPSQFADWIEQLAAEEITGGCGGGDYCPSNPVTRAQMAVFLLKTEHGSSYAPPPCTAVFADVPCPSLFAAWIEQLAAEEITGGCGGDSYCPASPSTRGQMAVFLTKTFL